MKGNTRLQWPAINAELKVIFDKVTNEFGPPDVDFRAGLRIIRIHKTVLEKHSSVLKAKLSDAWQTSGDVLQLDEKYVEPEVIKELLTWMYYTNAGKDWKCSTMNAYSLCVAADYLLISELVTSCGEILCKNITPENFYDLFTLSKHLNLDDLHWKCERSVANSPETFLLSPQIVKCEAEDLEMFIIECLGVEDSPQVHQTILSSLGIWAGHSLENRFRKAMKLLEFVPPEGLSSDALFRFMQTELYSKLDESHRKQYYVRSYLPTGVSSPDKLFCINRTDSYVFLRTLKCLDLSADQKWSSSPTERFIFTLKEPNTETSGPVFGLSWHKNMVFLRNAVKVSNDNNGYFETRHRHIKVFSTETGEWISSELSDSLDHSKQLMLAGAVLDDYIYITESHEPFVTGRKVTRYCLKTFQWKNLQPMETLRETHQLVALNGLLYAIGGDEALGDQQRQRPERYDPLINRWEYIAPSNYHHENPVAVAHEGQIYVLSSTGFEVYSPEADRWSELPVPDVCNSPSLVSIAGRLWLLTSWIQMVSEVPKVSRRAYEFDVVDRKWIRLPDLPGGKYCKFSIVIKQ